MKLLIYTIAFDPPGENYHRTMAQMFVSSVLRCGFGGDVLVFTNSDAGLVDAENRQCREIPLSSIDEREGVLSVTAKTFKFRAREYISATDYSKVMFVDCDCIFRQDPTLLFSGDAMLMYAEEAWSKLRGPWHRGHLTNAEMQMTERLGINSGAWWVRGEHYGSLMTRWEEVQQRKELRRQRSVDQSAWVRVVLDTEGPSEAFRSDAIRYPFMETLTDAEIENAILLHFAKPCPPAEKVAHMRDTFSQAFGAKEANRWRRP